MVSSVPKCYVGNRRISLQDRILQRGRLREEKNGRIIDPFKNEALWLHLHKLINENAGCSLSLLGRPCGQERFVK